MSPVPSVAAFIFVVTVAAVKQGWEDIRRHRADDKVGLYACCSNPVSPFPDVAAFIFVLTIAAVKQGYEDIRRHRADDKVCLYACWSLVKKTLVCTVGATCEKYYRDVNFRTGEREQEKGAKSEREVLVAVFTQPYF